MPHETQLIATITIAFTFAFAGGFLAARLRLPPLVGYLLAGIAVGPFTPGYVADATIAAQLAEIGVILLMFGVGIHFSIRELMAVRNIAVPGAVGQSLVATALGTAVAAWWGWSISSGVVLGIAISVASTVVLLRALMERDLLHSINGHIAVGWLIVEDLFTVLVLVLLPALATPLGGADGEGLAAMLGGASFLTALALALGKTALFAVLMFVVGSRVVPWLLVQVARTGSRELFTLSVLALALGIAFGAATLFGVSFALGAFVAGAVISESDLSHQAAADALPLRDAFSVLFFVSVGMLFDPSFVLTAPWHLLAVMAIIIFGKPLAAFLIIFAFGYPIRTGLIVAAALAQIGEFSFILADLGRNLGILPDEGFQLVLASALLSITLNPFIFLTVDPIESWIRSRPKLAGLLARRGSALARLAVTGDDHALRGHVVLCGYGRVGSVIGQALERRGFTYAVIEQDRRQVEDLRRRGIQAVYGDAANAALLDHLGVASARALVVALPDRMAVHQITEHVRRVNPRLDIVARAGSTAMREELQELGVSEAVVGDLELALEMTRHVLHRFGVDGREVQATLQSLRLRSEMRAEGEPRE